jgi:hypothetical protein
MYHDSSFESHVINIVRVELGLNRGRPRARASVSKQGQDTKPGPGRASHSMTETVRVTGSLRVSDWESRPGGPATVPGS